MNTLKDEICILVVSDNSAEATNLRRILQFEIAFKPIGPISSDEVSVRQVFELQPDVVLFDTASSDKETLEGIEVLHTCAPETSIIVLCPENAASSLSAQLSHAVKAILTKPLLADTFINAIIQAVRDVNQTRHFKRLTYYGALAMTEELKCDFDTLHKVIERLQTRNLVEAYSTEDDRCWVALAPKGEVVLSELQRLNPELSALEHDVLEFIHRLSSQ